MRTIVHLSDLHFGRVDRRILEPLIRSITAAAPDLIAVSGDLTQRALRGQFLQARAFLDALPFPRLVVPGNHDVPFYNVAARVLAPYAAYRRYVEADLEPMFIDGEIAVVGLNTARSFVAKGGGRLSEAQVARAAAVLGPLPPQSIKIVVTHHPFDLPAGVSEHHLVGRASMAMAELADIGADLFLAGHLHLSHVGHSAERYPIAGHSALVVQAGTMSTRGRGESNTFNLLRIHRPDVTVERHSWSPAQQTFVVSWSAAFRRSTEGWTA